MKCLFIVPCLLVLVTSPAYGLISWNYNSNDGTTSNVATGELTTTGSLAQALIPGTQLSLVSIDTVEFNGTDLTGPANWSTSFGAQPPPFSSFVGGTITVTATPGLAEVTNTGVLDFIG